MGYRLLLSAVVGVWTVCFLAGFIHFAVEEPYGEGFTHGYNRVLVFLMWQVVAFVLAVTAFVLTRRGDGSVVERVLYVVGHLPLAGSGILLIAFVGLVAYIGLFG